ncbi:MAG: hypothetical protein B7Y45_02605 [Sphingomonas sp. 28-66-16]|nr:MAG: hypothetical protein B7Y45_02605 [Sphingomonas sp. 28-66-16]
MIAWLIETLLATSLLMVAVLVLRKPVRETFGPSLAYALWALPVLRLCLPPLPGDWRLSALVAPAVDRSMHQGVVFGVMNADRLPHAIAHQALAEAQMTLGDAPIRMALVPPVSTSDGPSVIMLLAALWVAGTLAFLLYHLIAHRHFCRRIQHQARRRRQVAEARVEVIETDAATGPLAFGIWRKYVVFPSDFADRYDRDERLLALAHELTHHARGDLIANWVALVVLGLHWFNPIAWRAFRAFRADQEMACDARVLADRDPAFRHAYGRAIVKSAHGGAISAACHLHTVNELKGRLKMLSEGKKSRARIAGGAVAVLAVTVAGLGLTASGTQAAERLRTRMSDTIGVDLDRISLASAMPAPRALAAPVAAIAPQPTPIPPSSVAQDDLVPPPPPEPAASPLGAAPAEPPMPPLPPMPPEVGSRAEIAALNADHRKTHREMRFVFRDKKGRVINEDFRGLAEMPEITSSNCADDSGDGKNVVRNETVNGRHRIIICRNRVQRLAMRAAEAARIGADAAQRGADAARHGAEMATRAQEIERNAYRSALEGVRKARNGMLADQSLTGAARTSALKAMDEAIAELESDMNADRRREN